MSDNKKTVKKRERKGAQPKTPPGPKPDPTPKQPRPTKYKK